MLDVKNREIYIRSLFGGSSIGEETNQNILCVDIPKHPQFVAYPRNLILP